MIRPSLKDSLRQLRLSGLLSSLEVRLAEAAGNHLDHGEFLELLVQDELAVRASRQVERRVRAAMFRETKPLDEFDFGFNSSIKRKQIHDLATGQFIREKADVLFLGLFFLPMVPGVSMGECGRRREPMQASNVIKIKSAIDTRFAKFVCQPHDFLFELWRAPGVADIDAGAILGVPSDTGVTRLGFRMHGGRIVDRTLRPLGMPQRRCRGLRFSPCGILRQA